MKIGFTTLGCPSWDVDTICRRGKEFGFDGVDFRGLQESIDITLTPEFTTGLAETKAKFTDVDLAVSGISTSLHVCNGDKLEEHLEEARRTIALAQELNATTLRVFGGGDAKAHSKEELADIGQQTMEAVLDLDGARGFKWVFETHDLWTSAADSKLLLDRIPIPEFGALWDMGHTTRVGGETPAESLAALGDRIYCLHVKDAVRDAEHSLAMNDGWRYVPPGTGELPLAEALGLLSDKGFDGWLIFEHEKRWHDELPEPEEAYPDFMKWIRSVLGR